MCRAANIGAAGLPVEAVILPTHSKPHAAVASRRFCSGLPALSSQPRA